MPPDAHELNLIRFSRSWFIDLVALKTYPERNSAKKPAKVSKPAKA